MRLKKEQGFPCLRSSFLSQIRTVVLSEVCSFLFFLLRKKKKNIKGNQYLSRQSPGSPGTNGEQKKKGFLRIIFFFSRPAPAPFTHPIFFFFLFFYSVASVSCSDFFFLSSESSSFAFSSAFSASSTFFSRPLMSSSVTSLAEDILRVLPEVLSSTLPSQ